MVSATADSNHTEAQEQQEERESADRQVAAPADVQEQTYRSRRAGAAPGAANQSRRESSSAWR